MQRKMKRKKQKNKKRRMKRKLRNRLKKRRLKNQQWELNYDHFYSLILVKISNSALPILKKCF
jgi:hypothetical protein